MCGEEGANLQRGMNYRIRDGVSVILMSLRPNAPYVDRIEQNGEVLIYEGHDIDHPRLHPTSGKLEEWKRDKGKCAKSGSRQNLHFDDIIPYSRGGSSRDAANIQILCARHNLEKSDNIE